MIERIVLFDGVCNLCHGSVQFIIKRDPYAKFRFASLQSEAGQELLDHHQQPLDLKTIVLIEDGQAYVRSTAALRICKQLGGGWPLLAGCLIIPTVLRDAVYKFVANNRYKWFGQKEACPLPSPATADRFLDAPKTGH